MRRITIPYLKLILFDLILSFSLQAQQFPAPVGAVNDFANVIPAQTEREIEGICLLVWEKTSTAIADVTIPTLGDNYLEDYATRLYETWGLGKKGEDKGVLILNAIQERKVRIETGYGVEGILTDGTIGEIIDRYMLPYLKQGDYGAAHLNGVKAVARIIADDAGIQLTGDINRPVSQTEPVSIPRFGKVLGILFFIFLILITRGRILPWLILGSMFGGRRGHDDWGGFGGRGGGGFGGGFGGFGGGMSGGGGASRSY